MSLITEDWRLKLMATGLAVLMLGAVAFYQNPPTTGSLTIPVNYRATPDQVLINPPLKINITYTGLADAIKNVNTNNTTASVDASNAQPGTTVRVPVRVTTIPNVTVQSVPPILVGVDTLQTKDLTVTVAAKEAPGWVVVRKEAICPGSQPTPCVVHFTGPASWANNLAAFVTVTSLVSATSIKTPNLPIQLQNKYGPLDLTTCRTQPCASLDISNVGVRLEASRGSTSNTVALVIAPPSHKPAPGYRITDVSISPNTVVISGEASVLARIRFINLAPVDLSGKSSDATFDVQITYPDGTSGLTGVNTATVRYSISADPNV
jgi:YbbR domain-containing protein